MSSFSGEVGACCAKVSFSCLSILFSSPKTVELEMKGLG